MHPRPVSGPPDPFAQPASVSFPTGRGGCIPPCHSRGRVPDGQVDEVGILADPSVLVAAERLPPNGVHGRRPPYRLRLAAERGEFRGERPLVARQPEPLIEAAAEAGGKPAQHAAGPSPFVTSAGPGASTRASGCSRRTSAADSGNAATAWRAARGVPARAPGPGRPTRHSRLPPRRAGTPDAPGAPAWDSAAHAARRGGGDLARRTLPVRRARIRHRDHLERWVGLAIPVHLHSDRLLRLDLLELAFPDAQHPGTLRPVLGCNTEQHDRSAIRQKRIRELCGLLRCAPQPETEFPGLLRDDIDDVVRAVVEELVRLVDENDVTQLGPALGRPSFFTSSKISRRRSFANRIF